MTHALALVSVRDRDQARRIATALVEQRMAACVQMVPIESIYSWDGKIDDDTEVLLVAKTRVDAFPALERTVLALHDYDVPEILMVEVTAGHAPYLAWIDGLVERPRRGDGPTA